MRQGLPVKLGTDYQDVDGRDSGPVKGADRGPFPTRQPHARYNYQDRPSKQFRVYDAIPSECHPFDSEVEDVLKTGDNWLAI